MKKFALLFSLLSLVTITQAQNCNAVFFTQDNTKFQVVLNGILQNPTFETNVKVTGLSYDASYRVTINFEDKNMLPLNKSVYMMEDNSEFSYEITKNKKGVMLLRVGSVVPLSQAPNYPVQSEVSYTTTAPVVQTNPVNNVQITETQTTTINANPNSSENISMNVNIGDMGMNVNINVNDNLLNSTETINTTKQTTVTTTTTQSGSLMVEPETTQTISNVGCSTTIGSADFKNGLNSVEKQSFADTKLKVAKNFTRSNCLTVNQIKQVIALFSFEENKLEYAKFAYDYCVDKNNYFQLSDVFSFSSSTDELNDFLENK